MIIIISAGENPALPGARYKYHPGYMTKTYTRISRNQYAYISSWFLLSLLFSATRPYCPSFATVVCHASSLNFVKLNYMYKLMLHNTK